MENTPLTYNEIWEILEECCDYCKTIYNWNNILGFFIYGEANYGMAYKKQDIHVEMIYIPTFNEMCLINKEELKPKYIINNSHSIRVKDLRTAYNSLKNGELDLAEALYTKYKILNPKYLYIFNSSFIDKRDNITKANKEIRLYEAAKKGLEMLEDYKEYLTPYAIYSAARWAEFCVKYDADKPYEECLYVTDKQNLFNLKYDHDNFLNKSAAVAEIQDILTPYANITPTLWYLEEPSTELKTAIIDIFNKSLEKDNTKEFINSLTEAEMKALHVILDTIGLKGEISISKLTNSSHITRQTFNSLFNKLKTNNVASIENRGVKGTCIVFRDNLILDFLEEKKNET